MLCKGGGSRQLNTAWLGIWKGMVWNWLGLVHVTVIFVPQVAAERQPTHIAMSCASIHHVFYECYVQWVLLVRMLPG